MDRVPLFAKFNTAISELANEDNLLYWVKTTDAPLNADSIWNSTFNFRNRDFVHWDYSGMKLIASRFTYLATEVFGLNDQYDQSLINPPAQDEADLSTNTNAADYEVFAAAADALIVRYTLTTVNCI